MTDLSVAVTGAIEYLSTNSIDVPADVWYQAIRKGVLKADGGDLAGINAAYHDAITKALITYLEGGSVVGPRNSFKRAMIEAFGGAADLGWTDGGGSLPFDGEALEWFNARTEAELGFVDLLFQQAKELRKEEDFDILTWVSARADGYTNTLREVYNNLRMRAIDNIMVTFDGDDGAESCPDCQKLKGKRHKISWFVSRDYIPPFGRGLECHRGGHCEHGLRKDNGEWVTV